MSRPAFIVALTRVLKRQPTLEEYAEFRAGILEICPAGRVWVSSERRSEAERKQEIANLLAEGLSIRAIARQLKCDRRDVREVARVGGKSAFPPPTY